MTISFKSIGHRAAEAAPLNEAPRSKSKSTDSFHRGSRESHFSAATWVTGGLLALSKLQGAFAGCNMTALPGNQLGVACLPVLPPFGEVPGLACDAQNCTDTTLPVAGLASFDTALAPGLSNVTTQQETTSTLLQVLSQRDSFNTTRQQIGANSTLALRGAPRSLGALAGATVTDNEVVLDTAYRTFVVIDAGEADPLAMNNAGQAAWSQQFNSSLEIISNAFNRLAAGDDVTLYISNSLRPLSSIGALSDLHLSSSISYAAEPFVLQSQPQLQRAAALGANVLGIAPPEGVPSLAEGDSALVRAATGLLTASYNNPQDLVGSRALTVLGPDAGKTFFQAFSNDAATVVQAQARYPQVNFVPDSITLSSATTQDGQWSNATAAWCMAIGARTYGAAGGETYAQARQQTEYNMAVGNVDATTTAAVLLAYDNTNAALAAVGSAVNGTNPV